MPRNDKSAMQKPLAMTVSVGGGVKATVRFTGGELQPVHVATLMTYLDAIRDMVGVESPRPADPLQIARSALSEICHPECLDRIGLAQEALQRLTGAVSQTPTATGSDLERIGAALWEAAPKYTLFCHTRDVGALSASRFRADERVAVMLAIEWERLRNAIGAEFDNEPSPDSTNDARQ